MPTIHPPPQKKMPGSIFSTDTGPTCARNVKGDSKTPDKLQTWVMGAVWIGACRFCVNTKSGKGGKIPSLLLLKKHQMSADKKSPRQKPVKGKRISAGGDMVESFLQGQRK